MKSVALTLTMLLHAYADLWYPKDITFGTCSNDPTQRPSTFTEVNLTMFETGEQCCEYWYSWQNDDRCKLAATNKYRQGDGSSGDSPTIILYYPTDLTLGICDNNVSQRPNSFVDLGYTLFLTAEDCCKYWYHWQQSRSCFLNSPVDPETSDSTVDPPSVTTTDSHPDATTDEYDAEKTAWPVEESYLVNDVCYDASIGIRNGIMFGSRQECCLAIASYDARNQCLVNKPVAQPSSPDSQPASPVTVYSTPNSALLVTTGRLGSMLIASILGFQFM